MLKKWMTILAASLVCFALVEFVIIPYRDREREKDAYYQRYEQLNSPENITKTVSENLSVFQQTVVYLESEKTNRVYDRRTEDGTDIFYIWENEKKLDVNVSELDENIIFILTKLDFEFISINESYVEFGRHGYSRDGTYIVMIEYYKNDVPDHTRHKITDNWYYFKIGLT